jgi:hypothetical protein
MQDICPFRGAKTPKPFPDDLFRPPPPKPSDDVPFRAVPIMTMLSGRKEDAGTAGRRRQEYPERLSRLPLGGPSTTLFGGNAAAASRIEALPGIITICKVTITLTLSPVF